MNASKPTVFTIVALLISFIGWSQASSKLEPAAFEKMLTEKGAQVVDVRTPEEFRKGFIQGAVNYNINSKEFTSQVKTLDKTKSVLVYCLSGPRSTKAADYLRKQGFARVYELKGGMMAWNRSKKPISSGMASKGLSVEEFNAEVNKDKLVLVDFHARWCGPCKKMAPDLEALKEKYSDQVILMKVDADENNSLVDNLNVQALPTLQLYRNGEKVWSHTGYLGKKEIEKNIQDQL